MAGEDAMIGFAMMLAAQDIYALAYISPDAQSCSDWRLERKGKAPALLQNWVMGYVTAYNMTSRADGGVDAEIDAVFGWVDRYCLNHRKASVSEAAVQLVREMPKRRKLPNP
jgi:hypothetical protein